MDNAVDLISWRCRGCSAKCAVKLGLPLGWRVQHVPFVEKEHLVIDAVILCPTCAP